MTLTIGKSADGPVTIDVERLIESRLLVTASSGGGKSYLLRKILEQVSAKTQTIVIDVEGEFATLREKRDMVLAGPNGEVPAEVRSAALLCRRLMELNLSAVIDISELTRDAKRDFVSKFCHTLVELPRSLWRPCFVCIDETHEFSPEGEKSASKEAVALLASKGRKRGYCLLAATQRLAKLDKDIAAECRNQFIGMLNLDLDRNRAAATLGFGKERLAEIRDLSPPGREGEFFCFGPAFNVRGVVKMRGGIVETTHPKAGQGRLSKPPEPSAKISGVLGELKDLAKKADEEAKTLADAQKRIRELERELKAKPAPVTVADTKAIERAVAAAIGERDEFWKGQMREIQQESTSVIKSIEDAVSTAKALFARSQYFSIATRGKSAPHVNGKPKPALANDAAPKRVAPPIQEKRSFDSGFDSGTLPKGEAAVLTALIQFPEGRTREQLTVLTAYKRSSRDAYIQRLREKGLVECVGDVVQATMDGVSALPNARPLPIGEALQEHWLQRLPEGERKILECLIEAYPDAVTKDSLIEATGYMRSSRDAYLQRMRAKQLIEEPSRGEVRASENLF